MITCYVTEGRGLKYLIDLKPILGFSLAAATGNDPLAAGNIAATLVLTI